MAFENVLAPIKIKDVEIRNRVVVAPMNSVNSTQDGYVTPQNIAHLARRAKGGFGLIITDCVIATRLAAPFVWHRNLYLYDESFIPGLNMMADACHAFGAKIFLQLSIGFGRAGHAIDETPPYAPSRIPYVVTPDSLPKLYRQYVERVPAIWATFASGMPREMTIEEIQSEEEEYAEACKRAVIAGYDGIEIHAPHGYLEHQFLSPRSNKRTDLYGGSFENRMRFLVEVGEKALEAVKDAIPVGVRLSCNEHQPDGITHEEFKAAAKKMAELGVAYVDLSDGSHEGFKWFFPESDKHIEEHLLPEAKGMRDSIREAADIPVITPSVHDPNMADRAIKEGQTDMIGLGRQSLADPDWPNKLKEGKADKITKCLRDSMCAMRAMSGLYMRCTVNRELGYEQYDPELFPKRRAEAIMPPGITKLR
jgi:2,4-dienoyl-CoA reductase-like NADH-dependent reductase (Old Yellow Enzyme family)